MTAKEFGIMIRHKRQDLGITTRELAQKACISHPMVVKTERGERNPGMTTVLKLAMGVGYSQKETTKLMKKMFDNERLSRIDRIILNLLIAQDISNLRERVTPQKESSKPAEGSVNIDDIRIFFVKALSLSNQKVINTVQAIQVFDSIADDPSLLESRFNDKEAKVPLTYILLRKKDDYLAQSFKKKVCRDFIRVTKRREELAKKCAEIGGSVAPSIIDKEVLTLLEHAEEGQKDMGTKGDGDMDREAVDASSEKLEEASQMS